MKKYFRISLSLVLAFCMMLSVCVFASAATVETPAAEDCVPLRASIYLHRIHDPEVAPEVDVTMHVPDGDCVDLLNDHSAGGALVYGNPNAGEHNFAEITNYLGLYLEVANGSPVLLFNYKDAGKTGLVVDSKSKYVTVDGNKWYVNIQSIAGENGGALLNKIYAASGTVKIARALLVCPESRGVVADSCDDLYAWTNQNQGEFYIDREDYITGTGSLFLDMPATDEGVIRPDPFAAMLMLTFDEYYDCLNKYPIVEVMYKPSVKLGETGLQINCVDNDVANSDGFNTNHGLNNSTQNGPEWHRISNWVAGSPIQIKGADAGHITNLRISWLSYANGHTYYECDWHIDGVIFCTPGMQQRRAYAEEQMAAMIKDVAVPTSATIASLEGEIAALKAAFDENSKKYLNFWPENFEHYREVMNAYAALKKADFEVAAVEAISAIGDITIDNYTDKLELIETAEAKIADLDNMYGKKNYTVSNLDTLTAARKAYTNFESAEKVIKMVEELPDAVDVTAEHEQQINDAVAAFNNLNADAKAIAALSCEQKLNDVTKALERALNPYTVGDIDGKDGISAADALLALQHSVGKITLEDNALLAADVDGEGGVTATDALLILQFAVKKIDKFPASAN